MNPFRQALWPLGLLYGTAMAVRNSLFEFGWLRRRRLPVPVISVGNLTIGGTGKTPTVLWLAERLLAAGRKVGVLARGYGRRAGEPLNDEGLLLQRRLPELLQDQDPDRHAAGLRLVARGCDVLLLDDGFQHRRLHRDFDLLLLDAVAPFADGQCLPAGDLREFRSGIGRAGAVVLTRCSGLDDAELDRRRDRLRELVARPELPVWCAEHAPRDVRVEPGGELVPAASLAGRRVVLLSALARPDSFADTVRSLGAAIVAEHRHRDHHWFTAGDLHAAAQSAAAADAWLLVTEKDAVRIADPALAHRVLRIDLRWRGAEPDLDRLGLR